MGIQAQGQAESPFDVRRRSGHIHQETIGVSRLDAKTIRGQEFDHALIVLLGWTKPFSEFFGSEIMVIVGAGWVVDLPEKICEPLWIAQVKANCKLQISRGREAANGRQLRHFFWHMAAQELPAGLWGLRKSTDRHNETGAKCANKQ